ncbi:hypothetical protein GUJ93_ZPchr0006g41793 [Zizania palustris]|uniref:Uncharacterized protein n=1 Tax=Zizania palustris TaxID=103762 RepID=A0A8J5SRT5_ZIZPA|nr:hypothetical protein GUJ93_ZPchr0006g41793 [Zizania palustris]
MVTICQITSNKGRPLGIVTHSRVRSLRWHVVVAASPLRWPAVAAASPSATATAPSCLLQPEDTTHSAAPILVRRHLLASHSPG